MSSYQVINGSKIKAMTRVISCIITVFAFLQCASLFAETPTVKARGTYLRLRNLDPSGDNPAYRGEWDTLASSIRAGVVQHEVNEEYALLRILGAETHLRLYRATKEQAYLTSARALINPVAESELISPSSRAQALMLAGDAAIYAGTLDSAELSYMRAQRLNPNLSSRVADRVQGIRNGTFRRRIPSTDIEVPRLAGEDTGRAKIKGEIVVVLDPGHGGLDFGAVSAQGGEEKEITLDVARRVKVLLERRHHLNVKLTREDDSFVPLARRTAYANRKRATMFVSLHVNASERHDAQGLEAYYLDNTNDEASRKLAERENGVISGDAVDDLSFMLSDLIQSGKMEDSIVLTRSIESGIRSKVITAHPQLRSLGVKKAPFFVLVGAHMPCALVEMFFIDNPIEGAKLRQDSFRSALAMGIAQGIAQWITDLPKRL